jgi:hypothetical protein
MTTKRKNAPARTAGARRVSAQAQTRAELKYIETTGAAPAEKQGSGGDVTALRLRLKAAGFSPIPVNGKAPHMPGWQSKVDVPDAEIASWSTRWGNCASTSVLTVTMPTLDIDVLQEDAADAVEALARERFGGRGRFLVRVGRPPKRAVPLRTDRPFDKMKQELVAPDGTQHKIEILCDGQQLVCFGIHPDTRLPYSWRDGAPGEVRSEELPFVTEEEAAAFLTDATRVLVERFGFVTDDEKKTEDGERGHADWERWISGLQSGADLHDAPVRLAAAMVASGMGDGAAINLMRAIYEAATCPHDERWLNSYNDIVRNVRSAREKFERDAPATIPLINISNWDNEPVPQQEWAVRDRIPVGHVTLFSGEGAAGKSLIYLQLSVAHGRDPRRRLPSRRQDRADAEVQAPPRNGGRP